MSKTIKGRTSSRPQSRRIHISHPLAFMEKSRVKDGDDRHHVFLPGICSLPRNEMRDDTAHRREFEKGQELSRIGP